MILFSRPNHWEKNVFFLRVRTDASIFFFSLLLLLLLLLYLLFCSCSRHPVHPGGPGTYDDLPVPFLGPKSGTIVFCPSAATATNTSPVAA